ncbi:sigma-70 family RNA polymerase sigma factor [Sediminispirochaeta smaragdinae]|jgi:RNA polymerase primary sigma factor|uniref:RNA polymerase, sigma 70 subunit, RpoD subfamily n=1 Tax=Sediminispirochaeta smaragdinae (strain DSM 11293 / JCM 15392 / SEBR 4228) TaxID=573413 RepID=E1R8H3_SEDSS|nr:sigma-70 family RNA polymerase sigma factor [Sediminispirochaeta smaragdinae]ADK79317.1 RNA polymerase, sigma 70 subunit, RpoD subfamily [Sediminispirochaeta smaragdinae DSM 11293]
MKYGTYSDTVIDSDVDFNDSDPLSLYLKQISAYPLLTKEEELMIGREIQERKQELLELEELLGKEEIERSAYLFRKRTIEAVLRKSRDRMITSNLRLVVSIAKKYQHRGLSFLDLIDEGNIGLIEAVERFDYTKRCKFSTYGTWWIQQSVIKALADKGRTIRIPIHVLNIIRKLFSVTKHLTQELGRDPSSAEIAAYMDLPVERVESILQYSGETASLDVTVDDENITSLSDLVFSDDYIEPFESVFHVTLKDLLDTILGQLSEREQTIIKLRFGLADRTPLTLEEIGSILGITRERVRQIQNKAIEKLRSIAAIQELEEIV